MRRQLKILALLAFLGLAAGFALPTFAQQTTMPDPKLRQEILVCSKQFDDAMVNGDAAGLAARYTEGRSSVNDDGPVRHPALNKGKRNSVILDAK